MFHVSKCNGFSIHNFQENLIKVLKVRCVGYAVQDLKICGLKEYEIKMK